MKQQYYAESDVENAFTEYFSKIKKQVESELSKFVLTMPQTDLRSKIEYAVLSEGKRFRPFLVILSAESVGGEPEQGNASCISLRANAYIHLSP